MDIQYEELKEWVWFSKITNISCKKKYMLLEHLGSPKQIRMTSKEKLKKIKILRETEIDNIYDLEHLKNIDSDLDYMQKNKIELLNCLEDKYPKLLRQIYDFPVSIYVKGSTACLNEKALAIIGCRKSTQYGSKIAYKMSYCLSREHINIVSGLAIGIDTMAHIGSINAKGKTIAVIGSGLDQIYPKENENMIEAIVNLGGAVISEYPLGSKPLKMNFPARNRIISGLCNGLLVVEAKLKSGTMITVDFALEQGKNIYSIPGNITNENSSGTNELIKQGAKLITSEKEILEDYIIS